MKLWPRVKLGLIPLVIICIPVFLGKESWRLVDSWGLHLVGNDLADVPINLAILFVGCYLLGLLLELPLVKDFIKDNSLKLPVIGGLIYAVLVPHGDVRLVEIKTLWGSSDAADENWEYALVTNGPWTDERGNSWHRVHTLGWTGKLFSRVGKNNVRETGLSDRDVWMIVLSMGLLNPPKK